MSLYENEEFDYDEEEAPPEESSNRTFMIAVGILGGIVLLSIICLAGYALLILPQQRAAQSQQVNAATQNAQVLNAALTATFVCFPKPHRHRPHWSPHLPLWSQKQRKRARPILQIRRTTPLHRP